MIDTRSLNIEHDFLDYNVVIEIAVEGLSLISSQLQEALLQLPRE